MYDEKNVGKIIDDVKQEISEKGFINNDASFSDVKEKMLFGSIKHSNDLEQNIYAINNHYELLIYRKFNSKGFLGFFKTFVKRFARKLVSPYVEPIFADQCAVNHLLTRSITDIYFDMKVMKERIDLLEKENNKLRNEKHGAIEEVN